MNNQSCDTVNIVPARRKIGNTRISVSGLYPFKKDSAVAGLVQKKQLVFCVLIHSMSAVFVWLICPYGN